MSLSTKILEKPRTAFLAVFFALGVKGPNIEIGSVAKFRLPGRILGVGFFDLRQNTRTREMDSDVKIDVLAVKKLEKSCADFYFSAQRSARLRSLRF